MADQPKTRIPSTRVHVPFPDREVRGARVNIVVEPSTRAAVQRLAERQGKTISTMASELLRASLRFMGEVRD